MRRPKGPTREEILKWKRQNLLVMNAGFDTISEPNRFPIQFICYDAEIGDTMRSFGGLDCEFLEWREWLLPVRGTQQVGVSKVSVYEVV
jgi:hypothetical protein